MVEAAHLECHADNSGKGTRKCLVSTAATGIVTRILGLFLRLFLLLSNHLPSRNSYLPLPPLCYSIHDNAEIKSLLNIITTYEAVDGKINSV